MIANTAFLRYKVFITCK